MGLVWNPYAVPGFLAMILALAMAAFVYFAAPGGQHANRRLAFVLLLEACATGAGNGIVYVVDQANLARAAQGVSVTSVLLLPAAYLFFMATVDSPLARFWNTRYGQAAIFFLGAVSVGAYFQRPASFIPGVSPEHPWYAPNGYDPDLGDMYRMFGWIRLAILLYCFIVALHAYQRATTKLGKRRAKAFAIAFGIWDATKLLTSFLFLVVVPRLTESGNISTTGNHAIDLISVVYYPITIILFVPLLAMGILRTQLFEIDLKIRFTINKGVLASGAILAFFVVEKLIEQILGNEYGLLGGALAGITLFLISPAQKAAERIAEKATPGAKGLNDLTRAEKVELYKEQLEFAFADGAVSKKERMLLEHLRNRLGVARDDAHRMEEKFLAAFGRVRPHAAPA